MKNKNENSTNIPLEDRISTPTQETAPKSGKNRAFKVFWYTSTVTILTLMIVPPLFGSHHYFLDLFSHFQLQYTLAGISLVVLGGFVRTSRLHLGIFLIIITAHTIGLIYPVSLSPYRYQDTNTENQPNLLFMNANYFNEDIEPLITVFVSGNTDTIAIVELNEKVHLTLKAMFGKPAVFRDEGAHSCGIFTSLEYEEVDITDKNFIYPVCAAKIDGITHIVIHPYPPLNATFFENQKTHFKEIREYIDELDSNGEQYILMGDFNSTYYSSIFRENFNDLRHKNTYSWSVWEPQMMPIDHALSNMDVKVQRSVKTSSDHTGLFVWW